jgi:DNA end-binding protein Ku
MARSLVDAMTAKWNPHEFHDDYAEALMKVIEEKIAAGGKELPKHGPPPSTKVVDIVAMLQQSLKQARKVEPKKKPRKAA